jgi:hypothetical protein
MRKSQRGAVQFHRWESNSIGGKTVAKMSAMKAAKDCRGTRENARAGGAVFAVAKHCGGTLPYWSC